MTDSELTDRIKEIFITCDLHLKRMEFARSKVGEFIPLNMDNYFTMDDETIGFLDQFIFRFSKLQDTMGTRLFPLVLEILAEPIEGKAFIDILNRLEKLGIIDSAIQWIQLRKIRNDISHEYPASLSERIEGINYLFDTIELFKQITKRCRLVAEKYQ